MIFKLIKKTLFETYWHGVDYGNQKLDKNEFKPGLSVQMVSGASYEALFETSFASLLFDFTLRVR